MIFGACDQIILLISSYLLYLTFPQTHDDMTLTEYLEKKWRTNMLKLLKINTKLLTLMPICWIIDVELLTVDANAEFLMLG